MMSLPQSLALSFGLNAVDKLLGTALDLETNGSRIKPAFVHLHWF